MYLFYFAYPVLASFIMPVLLYTNNRGELKFYHFFSYIIIDCFIVFLFEYVLYKFMYLPVELSAVITFFAVILFYTPFYRFKRIFSRYWVQYFLKYLFYAVCGFLIYYIDGYIPLILSISLFLMLLVYIISGNDNIKKEKNNEEQKINSNVKSSKDNDLPDVYHIIYDMYLGFYGLDKLFGYDNSYFYKELGKKGFKVYPDVYSNYIFTISSVPSFMNMDYTFNYLKPRKEGDYRYPFQATDLGKFVIESNVVTKFTDLGYKVFLDYENRINQKSIKNSANSNKNITALGKKSSILNDFLLEILQITILSNIVNSDSHIKYIHRKLDDIANFPKLVDGADKNLPHYFFIKVTFPHPPFVFDSNGNVKVRFNKVWSSYEEITDDNMNIMYLDNLKGCNPLILQSLDNLIDNIKNNNRKSIVLIHSDHGNTYGKKPFLIQKFNALYAVYTFGFKDNDYKNYLPQKFSLVNSMRYLFNFISDSNLDIKEDKFFDQDIKQVYKVHYQELDVTNELQDEIKEYMDDKKNKKL